MRRDWNKKLIDILMERVQELGKSYTDKVAPYVSAIHQSDLFDKYPQSLGSLTPTMRQYKKEYAFAEQYLKKMSVDDVLLYFDYIMVMVYAPVVSLDANACYRDLKIHELKKKYLIPFKKLHK